MSEGGSVGEAHLAGGSPLERALHLSEEVERLGGCNTLDRSEFVENLEEAGCVLADCFGHDVESAGGDNDVVDVTDLGDPFRNHTEVGRCTNQNPSVHGETESEWIGHTNDLDDAFVE